MKRFPIKRASILLSLVFTLIITSCSSKFSQESKLMQKSAGDPETPASDTVNADYNVVVETPATFPPDVVKVETDPAVKDVLNTASPDNSTNEGHWAIKELDGLKKFISPYLTSESELFAGKESVSILNQYVLNSSLLDEPIPVSHLETLIRCAFYFRQDDESNQFIKMYLTDFNEDGFISREAATAGMMKLISARYPISLGGNAEDFIASDAITDLNECEDRFEFLIRQAFCEGLTDQTVDASLNFRPKDSLSYGEAVSMVYRVLSKYGLYEPVQNPSPDSDNALSDGSIEWMQNECADYYQKLQSDNQDSAVNKMNILKKAEGIIEPGSTLESWNQPMEIEKWQSVLCDALGLNRDEVLTYTTLGQDSIFSWDIAAISIFKLGFKLNAFDIRDATEPEIESARAAVNNFDSAMDISKFAQMYASGILSGICEDPGFSPNVAVSRGETLLLVKRIVEHMP